VVKKFNISAAYDLAEFALSALNGVYDVSDCLPDFLAPEKPEFSERLVTPDKHTLLHTFLENWEYQRWEESFHVLTKAEDFHRISLYLTACNVSMPADITEETADSREADLWKLIERAMPAAAEASFQLLFQDREFLLRFQRLILLARSKSGFADRRIDRASYLPEWLRKGIFYRDRGRCQQCGKDISGLLNLDNFLHLDHVLPLEAGGCNDPTNFQLLCSDCNLTKSGKVLAVTNSNNAFW
jgi:hypothetical protein